MGSNYGVLYHLVSLYGYPYEAEMQRSYPSDLGLASFQALIDGDFVLYLVFSIEQSVFHEMVPGNEKALVIASPTAKRNYLWTRPEAQCHADHFLLPSNSLKYKRDSFWKYKTLLNIYNKVKRQRAKCYVHTLEL